MAHVARDYGIAAQILRELGISRVRLLTNNPRKIAGLQRYGVQVVERIALESTPHDDNIDYLRTKREKLGHFLTMRLMWVSRRGEAQLLRARGRKS